MTKNIYCKHSLFIILKNNFNHNQSTFIKQLIYWISKCGRTIDNLEGKWIYNTLNSWLDQFPYWSMSTLRRTIKSLEESGILLSKKVNAKHWKHTKWYSIDFNKLNKVTVNNNQTNNIKLVEKRANRYVQNEQIIYTNNIYTKDTKVSSSKRIRKKNIFKHLNQEFDSKINKLIERKVDNKLNYINKKENRQTKSKLRNEQLKKVKEMKEVWNKVFEYSINPVKAYMNRSNEKILYRLIEEKFEGDVDKWKEYACKVNSSKFLMGEKKTKTGFKASFAWLIKGETVDKINAGEYGIGDRELDQNNVSSNIETQKEEIIRAADKKITDYIKQKVNDKKEQNNFQIYIKKEEYIKDNDKYGIEIYVQNIGSYNLINNPENKGILKTIYDTYLVRKYFKRSRFKIKEDIRKMVNDKVQEKSLLKNLVSLQNLKESLNYNCIERNNLNLLACS